MNPKYEASGFDELFPVNQPAIKRVPVLRS